MCGIFGYIGKRNADVALMTYWGLRDLEYRGYDSWGIAAATANGFFVRKSVGKISETDEHEFRGISGKIAIGHSRWATHGGVTEVNSHPHFDKTKSIAVIHNGIIENHEELRAFLEKGFGVRREELFVSETDTEVVPHLIRYFIDKEGKDFEDAFVAAVLRLEGRFALVAMKLGESYVLATREGSPLVVGHSADGFFLASDVPAFLDYTRTVYFPGDREYVRVSAEGCIVRELDTQEKVEEKWVEIEWDKSSATKEGYAHYMLKEMLEQPAAIDQAIRQEDAKLQSAVALLRKADRIFLVGSGTAGKVAKLGEILFAQAGLHATAIVGSEHRMYARLVTKKSVIVAVSQSGETADVLEMLEGAKKIGAKVISILNVIGSSMDRLSDQTLLINVGPEIAVASTKAATAQIAVLLLLAGVIEGKLPERKHELRKAVKELKNWLTPDLVRQIKKVAETMKNDEDCYLIGRGLNAPIAHEGAIKIQEVSYVHAEGFAGGELKHGPIALISVGTPAIALIPNDETKREMESNMTELKARGARIIGIAPEPNKLFDEWIPTPDVGIASPVALVVPLQILAYHLAVLRGNDPDKPRNLAKSVTVK